MNKFTVLNSVVTPLDRANVDTDQIIPKQFLASIKRTGYSQGLFAEWRKDPNFVLNRPQYKGSGILLARKNFGCGSSREHAPWAIQQYGFRALIAPSFADIFFNNCFKNGLLPIVLPEATVSRLFDEVAAFPGYSLTIDLERQVIVEPQGNEIPFEVQPFRKYCLLNGLDDIGLTLRHKDKIAQYEAQRLATKPWLAHTLNG